ncbi:MULTISPECIES: alanine racemase [Bacillaceae]|uniref:Alanine racemase n=1 Tax=Oceanobacillus caeni TaxID=405946 RepID=A0ABR5MIJ0_9BACI|nr:MULTISPECIES: alanine racemase [Bacillaceae]KPH74329.1 alanine racemase [Oceanobacillus caeni]MED4475805.1 alanine racemase [Oceanobacillus caeni]
MAVGSYRDTWVEISLDALKSNVKAFKNHINPKTKLMAVIKADGYGHGAIEVAQAALEEGADYLAVAILDEALQIRKAKINAPVLVLGYTGISTETAVEDAINSNITLTVFTKEIAKEIVKTAEELKKIAKVHIKIDSGMNRIGIRKREEALELISLLTSNYVQIEGIFTHFADADNSDSTYTDKQFKHFLSVVDYLEEHDIQIPIKHCCNSAATISYPHMHMDMVRVGISLYGLYPSEHLKNKIKLIQVMSFKTKPVHIKNVDIGEPISYGCTFSTKSHSKIATIPVGYADGFTRALSNKGNVSVKGKRAPIVGRICMDQSMIDITDIPYVSKEDTVTIFGEPSDGFISLDEVAEQLQTIHYEIVCLIGRRVSRVYIQNGKLHHAKGL